MLDTMDTSFRIFLVACVCIAISLTANAKDHNCDLTFEDGTPLTDADWDGTIIQLFNKMGKLDDATPPTTVFYNFGANNIVSATVSTDLVLEPNNKYFLAKVEDSKMTMSTSSFFAQLEEQLERQTIGIYVDFTCNRGEATLVMQLNIKDTNNHDPTFDKPAGYTFNMLPMPLPSNFDISPTFEQIIVTDLDVTSKGLQLSLDAVGAEYFRVSSTAAVDKKKFQVVLTTTKKLQLTEQLDFMLSVSDLGTQDDATTRDGIPVKVTIIPNVEESVYEPKFEKSLYTATITDAKGEIQFDKGGIILNDIGPDSIHLSLQDGIGGVDYSSYIDCTSDSAGKVSCSWKPDQDTTELLEGYFALILLNAKQNTSEDDTVIYLKLPGPPEPTTTTSTTIMETTPQPCPTTPLPETTTVCQECPTTVTVTECDCTTPSITECPTFDTTTMCPTSTDPGGSETSTSDPGVSESSTSITECPTFDPTTMCPPSTNPGSTVETTCLTECPIFNSSTMCPSITTNSESAGPSSGTTECPTFDSSTMCPTPEYSGGTDESSCATECPTVCPTTDDSGKQTSTGESCDCSSSGNPGHTTISSSIGIPSSSNSESSTLPSSPLDPGESTTTGDTCDCSSCLPSQTTTSTTASDSSSSSDPGSTTSSSAGPGGSTNPSEGSTVCPVCPSECTTPVSTGTTECPTFDSSTMCPTPEYSGSTDESTCATECPTVCPTTDDSGKQTSTGESCDCSSSSGSPGHTTISSSIITPSSSNSESSTLPSSPLDPGQSTTTRDTCDCSSCPPSQTTTYTTASDSSSDPGSTTSSSARPGGSTNPSEGSTVCPVCPSECTTPVSTGTTEPGETPEFAERSYSVTINSSYTGSIVQPTLKTEIDNVEFTIIPNNEAWKDLVVIDRWSGEVSVLVTMDPAMYTFQLVATVAGTQRRDIVLLGVSVPNWQLCEDGTLVFPTLLYVVQVPENLEQVILDGSIESQDNNCTYIYDTNMPPTEDYFSVDANGRITVKSLDRESPVFNQTEKPTIKLTLHAKCGSDNPDEKLWLPSPNSPRHTVDWIRDGGDVSNWPEVVETIPNDRSSMVVVAIIQDENDNPPVFEPSVMTVGYPSAELYELLQPPSLATVQATDADVGLNAKLRYTVDEESGRQVTVHPISGVVYPLQTGFSFSNTQLHVTATDRDGEGPNQAIIAVNVVILSLEHVFELTVNGSVVEDTDSVVADISQATNYNVRVLSSAVVPTTTSSSTRSRRSLPRDDDDDEVEEEEASHTSLRLVLYALGDEDSLVTVDNVREKLNGAWQVNEVRQGTTSNTGGSSSEDVSGWVAAVITLAVLLVLILGGGAVAAYFLIVRPRVKKTSDYDRFSRESKDGVESNLSSVVPTIPPLTDDMLKKNDVQPSTEPVPDEQWIVQFNGDQQRELETADWDAPRPPLPEAKMVAETPPEHLLAPPVIPPARKRSFTFHSDMDVDEFNERRDERNESPDELEEYDDPDDIKALAGRKKSVVTFNDNVDTIEIERL